jgi:hypothetical protein
MSGLSTYSLGQMSDASGLAPFKNVGPKTGMFSRAGAMGGKYNLSNIPAAKGNAANQGLTTGIDQSITADAAGVTSNASNAARAQMADANIINNAASKVSQDGGSGIINAMKNKLNLGKIGEYAGNALQYAKDHPYQAILGASLAGGLMTKFGGPEETVDAIMDRGGKLDIVDIRTRVTEAFKDPSGEKLAALRVEFPFLGTQASKNTAIMADGGRAGYGLGSLVRGSSMAQPVSASMSEGDAPVMSSSGMGGMLSKLINNNPQLFKNVSGQNNSSGGSMPSGSMGGMFSKFFSNPRMYNQYFRDKENFIDENFNYIDDREEAAMGGRIRRAEGGIMDLGGMELDYRAEGGFVPIGAKEKADDVPARLSVNEFVFTADAVRNAGGGDIDQGAEIMERVMKNLEQGGQLSEESQGMQGARDMFQTSQRLGEVV